MAKIFTIGHGTRTTEELCSLLSDTAVELLVDVRRFPGSRRLPHLAREPLSKDLPGEGIAYEWWGEQLGGRRSRGGPTKHPAWRNAAFQAYADHMDEESFRDELERLEERASGERLAVMCAETVWWRCHRRLIADVLVVRGHEVMHIMSPGKIQAHPLNLSARPTDDGWIVYDLALADPDPDPDPEP